MTQTSTLTCFSMAGHSSLQTRALVSVWNQEQQNDLGINTVQLPNDNHYMTSSQLGAKTHTTRTHSFQYHGYWTTMILSLSARRIQQSCNLCKIWFLSLAKASSGNNVTAQRYSTSCLNSIKLSHQPLYHNLHPMINVQQRERGACLHLHLYRHQKALPKSCK